MIAPSEAPADLSMMSRTLETAHCVCCDERLDAEDVRFDVNEQRAYCIECFVSCRKDPRIDFLRDIGSCWPRGRVTA